MLTLHQIETEALQLPQEARLHLIATLRESLEESLEPIDSEMEQFWLAEVEYRWKEYQQGHINTLDASAAFQRANLALASLGAA
jgi:hypothetical protein